jgi:glycosyltransferase involved in cell wall biosynthesis
MACGVPVVVSPVGMNASVLAAGDVGYGATNEGEWIEALGSLAINESARRKMGASGRAVVESLYSATLISARLADTFRTVVGVTA